MKYSIVQIDKATLLKKTPDDPYDRDATETSEVIQDAQVVMFEYLQDRYTVVVPIKDTVTSVWDRETCELKSVTEDKSTASDDEVQTLIDAAIKEEITKIDLRRKQYQAAYKANAVIGG